MKAAQIFGEYKNRMSLAALGYTSNINELDGFTAQCFLIIAEEIERLKAEAMKK